jgi:hypothetical protein
MDNKILYTAKFTHHDLKFHKVGWKSDKRFGSWSGQTDRQIPIYAHKLRLQGVYKSLVCKTPIVGENTEIYSSLKLLHWLNLNCASIIGRSFTNFVFFMLIVIPRWLPLQDIVDSNSQGRQKPEALKSLYRSPGYKKTQLVLCKNYVLQWYKFSYMINQKFMKLCTLQDPNYEDVHISRISQSIEFYPCYASLDNSPCTLS